MKMGLLMWEIMRSKHSDYQNSLKYDQLRYKPLQKGNKSAAVAWHMNCYFAREVNSVPDFSDPQVCPIIYKKDE